MMILSLSHFFWHKKIIPKNGQTMARFSPRHSNFWALTSFWLLPALPGRKFSALQPWSGAWRFPWDFFNDQNMMRNSWDIYLYTIIYIPLYTWLMMVLMVYIYIYIPGWWWLMMMVNDDGQWWWLMMVKIHAGWWLTYSSEEWWSSSVGMMKFPIYGKSMKVIKFMFQTTN